MIKAMFKKLASMMTKKVSAVRVPRNLVALSVVVMMLPSIVGCVTSTSGFSDVFPPSEREDQSTYYSDSNKTEDPLEALARMGYYPAIGYEGKVYCNGDDCIKATSNEVRYNLITGAKAYEFQKVNRHGQPIGPTKILGCKKGRPCEIYRK